MVCVACQLDRRTPNRPYTDDLTKQGWLFRTDRIGCLYFGCDTVYQKPEPPDTEFKVYPNPIQNGQDLTIDIRDAQSATIAFYGIGKALLQPEVLFVQGLGHLPLSDYSLGQGVLLAINNATNKQYTQKLVRY